MISLITSSTTDPRSAATQEEFEDTKMVIRIRKYKKYRKHNGHTERYKKTNDDLHYNKK